MRRSKLLKLGDFQTKDQCHNVETKPRSPAAFFLNVMFMFLSNWEQSMTLHVVMFPGSLRFEDLGFCVSLDVTHDQRIFGHVKNYCQSNYCCVVFTSQREYATPNHLWEVAKPGDYFEFHLEYSC